MQNQKSVIKKAVIFTLLAAAIASVTVAGFLTWKFFAVKKFPVLAEGLFYGEIIFDEQKKLPLFIESRKITRQVENNQPAAEPEMKVDAYLLQDGWERGLLVGFDSKGNPLSNMDSYLEFQAAATILSSQQKVKLYGGADRNGYSGDALDVINGAEGVWIVKPLNDLSARNNPVADGKIPQGQTSSKPLLSLLAQFETLKVKKQGLESLIAEKSKEISSIKDYMLNEDKTNNGKGNSKPETSIKEKELKDLQEKINSQKEVTRQLNSQFQVSQKLIPSGRLAAAAREFMSLEGRYLENIMKGIAYQSLEAETPPDLVAKGENALKIRNEIESERLKIKELGTY